MRIPPLHSQRAPLWLLGVGLVCSASRTPASVVIQIGENFTASTYGSDSTAQPADSDGAAGPNHFVELINGRYAVFEKHTGKRVQTMTDLAFWSSAGITFSLGIDVTDPRIIFDRDAQRWFASGTDLRVRRQAGNRFLLAVSTSSDPTGKWHGFAFAADPVNGYFADFPTLGVDADGVYLGADMFDLTSNSVGPLLVSIPKNDLLANPPTVANRTLFGSLDYSTSGYILQPAVTHGAASTGESVVAIGDLGNDLRSHTTLLASTIQNAAAPLGATLSTATVLTVPGYSIPLNPLQPDGSRSLDDGDLRISASVTRVGDALYATHSVKINGRAAIRWYKINAANNTLIQSGTISDTNLNLFCPSIAANESGTVVIAGNGCSASTFLSSYAVAGETVNGLLSFGNLTLLKAGTASYRNPDLTGVSRWGDYSATTVDPTDPTRFWTIQMYPTSRSVWATQVTELITLPLHLSITPAGSNIRISWPAAVSGYQLQFHPTLAPSDSWSPVAQLPVVANNRSTVVLPLSASQGFFRLVNQ